MQAIRQHGFGEPSVLTLDELANPFPAAGEVRIRVDAAGVHLLDTMIRRGNSGGPAPLPTLPFTPGREVAGVIDALGPDVTGFRVGDRAVAVLPDGTGGYAELAIAPIGALHTVPESLTAELAVAMIGTGATAMAILELAVPTANDVAVASAAAGGIGTLLVQALRNAGATVVGVAGGSAKTALVSELGAAVAIDYSHDGWPQQVRDALGGRPVTLALDGVGGEIGRAVLELLGVGGRLVMFGTASGALTPLSSDDLYSRGISVAAAIGARLVARAGGLRALQTTALDQAATGKLRPLIGQRLPLAAAAEAHRMIEARETTGKSVLIPGGVA